MKLLTHAIFSATDFDDVDAPEADEDEDRETSSLNAEPPGRAIASFVDAGLRKLGWNVDYRWVTDYSHAFDCRAVKRRYDVSVQQTDQPDAPWLVTAKKRSGLFPKVFRGGADNDEHQRLLLDVHSVLNTDDRISGLGWFTEQGWRARVDEPGAPEPRTP